MAWICEAEPQDLEDITSQHAGQPRCSRRMETRGRSVEGGTRTERDLGFVHIGQEVFFRGKPIRTAYGGGWHTAFGKGRRTLLVFVETLGLRRTSGLHLAFVEPSRFFSGFVLAFCIGLRRTSSPFVEPPGLRRTFARPPGLRRTSSRPVGIPSLLRSSPAILLFGHPDVFSP